MATSIGNRWYKCDLHLHTPCSRCYTEKNDTPSQWVARALEQGLDAVAVTDHNDYRGIADIMSEGEKQGLSVFPGVEVTCDTSKIHILVLFDRTRNADTVRDFLNRCDIDSDSVGSTEGTSMSVFEVCSIAKKRGALVIAAHIDEFSSISGMNATNLDKLLSSRLLDAVQVANAPAWERYRVDKDMTALQNTLRQKYGPAATAEEIDRWRKCYARVQEAHVPMMAFSDDPEAPCVSAHGLWGIGSVYTWIQAAEIDLGGIRQALIAPETRIRTLFESVERPRTEPDFWLCSLDIRNTVLNPHNSIHLDFHPQLTCIVGGRGSGKTAVIHILCGIFRQLTCGLLRTSLREQERHYALATDDGPGYFREDTELEVRFRWYGLSYRLLVTDIKGNDRQTYHLYRIAENGAETLEPLEPHSFRSLMCAQVFIERQVMEIATREGCLLERVDRFIPDMYILQAERAYYADLLAGIAMESASVQGMLQNESRVAKELTWLEQMQSQAPDPLYPSMIERRRHASEHLATCRNRYRELQATNELYLKKYEECIEDIRKARSAFLADTILKDDCYHIELRPGASRSSLREALTEALGTAPDAFTEDVSILEKAMFSSDGGPQVFAEKLRAARKPDSTATGFTNYFLRLIRGLDAYRFERLLVFRPEDELVVSHRPVGTKRFREVSPTAVGQLSGAVLTLLLIGNLRPLIIDGPEAGTDNRALYEDMVPRIKRIKQERQLILSTHSANIAVNADPGMIIIMDGQNRFKRVKRCGSIDNPELRSELCDILEGTRTAFEERALKYSGGR